jgi:DNA replication regulator DPB11
MDTNESTPLQGKVFCCTAVEVEERNKIVAAIEGMGGVHKTNLMTDVTYLIVGSRETEKYEYAARHRGDMTFLVPEYLPKLYERWSEGEELEDIEVELSKGRLGVFERLNICFTNIAGSREDLINLVKENKGEYFPDLTRRVTHLVSPTKTGKKFQYGKKWGITIVSPEWLFQSAERGACLDPIYYSLDLPKEQIGKDAFIDKTLYRRNNPVVEKRKEETKQAWDSILEGIERHSQNNNLDREGHAWDEDEKDDDDDDGAPALQPEPDSDSDDDMSNGGPDSRPKRGIFDGHVFDFHGFNDKQLKILKNTVTSNFGELADEDNTATFYIINSTHSYKPDDIPPSMSVATERMIERSLYKKELIYDQWGEFVESRSISDFQGMRVATSGFSGIDELQLPKLLELIGARPQTVFNKTCELLIAKPDSRKVRYALHWDIPVVNVDWVFESIRRNKMVDLSSPRFVLDGKEAVGRAVIRKLPPEDAGENGSTTTADERRAWSIDTNSTTKREKSYYEYLEDIDSSSAKRKAESRPPMEVKRKDRKLIGRATTSNLASRSGTLNSTKTSGQKNFVFEEDERPKIGVDYADDESRRDRRKLLEAVGGDLPSQTLTQEENERPQMSPATDMNTSFQETLGQKRNRLRTRG